MIIDSHVHIGMHENIDMKLEYILKSMEKYKIDFSLVSSAEAEEYNGNLERLNSRDQVILNRSLIDVVKRYPDKLGALIWCKPKNEIVTDELEQLVEENLQYIYGFKFHPFHSQLPFNDPLMEPYIRLAEKFNLPIVSHTASSYESSPKLVVEMAQKYPNVDFVLVHMGLGTDNEESITLVSENDNVYGDTTWVHHEKVVKAIQVCGTSKILFGTDNPINGVDTLGGEFYQPFFTELKKLLSEEEYNALMYQNAMRIFNIEKSRLK